MRFPLVSVGGYVRLIGQLGSVQRTMCCYCGNENVASGDYWICFHCESVNRATLLSMKLNDQGLVSTLLEVNRYLLGNEYLNAINEYQKLVARYNEPEMLYNTGLIYMQYSNYQVSLIRYDRKGFMEENSLYREEASALASKAKLILNKASAMCQAKIKENGRNEFIDHTIFMINIKLGRLKSAIVALDSQENHNNEFLVNYEHMVLSAETKDYAATASYATKLLQKGMFSANAFYYIAWALFKTGRSKEALELLSALGKELQGGNVLALAQEIQKATTI